MKITYRGPRGRITRLGTHAVDVHPGDTVDVPAEVANPLVERGDWVKPTPKADKADKADKATEQANKEAAS